MAVPLQVVVATISPRMTTVFLRGALSRAGAARAIDTLASLDPKVRTAHIDFAQLRMFDVSALRAVLDFVREWANARDGCVSITPPSWEPSRGEAAALKG